MSLNHQTLERILLLQSAGKDWHIETYDRAVKFSDGTVRKCPHHVDGHNYSKKQNVNEKQQNESASTSNETPSSVVNLSLPSDSEFSESEDEM